MRTSIREAPSTRNSSTLGLSTRVRSSYQVNFRRTHNDMVEIVARLIRWWTFENNSLSVRHLLASGQTFKLLSFPFVNRFATEYMTRQGHRRGTRKLRNGLGFRQVLITSNSDQGRSFPHYNVHISMYFLLPWMHHHFFYVCSNPWLHSPRSCSIDPSMFD